MRFIDISIWLHGSTSSFGKILIVQIIVNGTGSLKSCTCGKALLDDVFKIDDRLLLLDEWWIYSYVAFLEVVLDVYSAVKYELLSSICCCDEFECGFIDIVFNLYIVVRFPLFFVLRYWESFYTSHF